MKLKTIESDKKINFLTMNFMFFLLFYFMWFYKYFSDFLRGFFFWWVLFVCLS